VNLDDFREARSYFEVEEWMRILLGAIDYDKEMAGILKGYMEDGYVTVGGNRIDEKRALFSLAISPMSLWIAIKT
jgi:predicted ATP-dependent Lon-type protease